MARLEIDFSTTKMFTFKDLEKAYHEGYMSCAEEHGHLDSIDSDINIAGIGFSEDDE